jgi:hypothetical protein
MRIWGRWMRWGWLGRLDWGCELSEFKRTGMRIESFSFRFFFHVSERTDVELLIHYEHLCIATYESLVHEFERERESETL